MNLIKITVYKIELYDHTTGHHATGIREPLVFSYSQGV